MNNAYGRGRFGQGIGSVVSRSLVYCNYITERFCLRSTHKYSWQHWRQNGHLWFAGIRANQCMTSSCGHRVHNGFPFRERTPVYLVIGLDQTAYTHTNTHTQIHTSAKENACGGVYAWEKSISAPSEKCPQAQIYFLKHLHWWIQTGVIEYKSASVHYNWWICIRMRLLKDNVHTRWW